MSDTKSEIIGNYLKLIEVFDNLHGDMKPHTMTAYNNFLIQYNELRKEDYEIAITGTVSAGKSSFINALLGRELLPRRKRATTNVATYIKHTSKNPQGDKEGYIAKVHKVVELNINSMRKELLEILKKEKYEVESESKKSYFGYVVAVITKNNETFLKNLITADCRGEEKIDCIDRDGKNDTFDVCRAKKMSNSLSDFYSRNRPIITNFINGHIEIEEKHGSLSHAAQFLEHNDKNHHVESITLYCDSDLLKKGVTLIDLPGSDNKSSEDKEITHKILSSDSISAAIFLYEFGKDPNAEEEAISNIINNNVLRKKNKLFIVFNKVDLGFKNTETLNDHKLITIPYFDKQLNTSDAKKIEYFYLSCAIHEGLSFGLYPDGNLKENFTDDNIFENLKKRAEIDIKNRSAEVSEEYGAFFDALEKYFEKIVSPNQRVTAANYQERAIEHIKLAKQSNELDFKRVFNLDGINKLMPFIKNNHAGMANFYDYIFTYLGHERTKDSYKKAGDSWNEFMNSLNDDLAEKTNSIKYLTDKNKWFLNKKKKLEAAFKEIYDQTGSIAISFHQDKIDDIKNDISSSVKNILDKLNDDVEKSLNILDYKDIISSLQSEYIDNSTPSLYLKNIFEELDIELVNYGEQCKRINVYYEDALLCIINTTSLIIKLKAFEYLKDIPDRLFDVFWNWFWLDAKITDRLSIITNLNIFSLEDLQYNIDEIISQDNYIEKIYDKIEMYCAQLYNIPGEPSIYKHYLNEANNKSGFLDLLSSNNEQRHNKFIEFFMELYTKQIEKGIEDFENNIQRFFRDWPSTDLKDLISDIFNTEGKLFNKMLKQQEAILSEKYIDDFSQLESFCQILNDSYDDITKHIEYNIKLHAQVDGLKNLLDNKTTNIKQLVDEYKKINN